MRSRITDLLMCLGFCVMFFHGMLGVAGETRLRWFQFTYLIEVENIPQGAGEVAVWIPYPVGDDHQEITDVKIISPYPTTLSRDAEYGNAILFLRVPRPKRGSLKVEMRLRVKRREYIRRDFRNSSNPTSDGSELGVEQWLQPDRLVPIDDHIRQLANQVVRGKSTDLEKARAIYDYAVSALKYDKSGVGWGRGDIYYACDVKRGNCTDFHALFIGFCRAVGIPAKFAIGFPLPEERGEGQIAGYHCWAEFYLQGVGWVPVDASEASKHPEKKEYYFGAHDENRVQFGIGRDIVLTPPQVGDPLNFFIYPYVEVDGKPFSQVRKRFYFKDLTSGRISRVEP